MLTTVAQKSKIPEGKLLGVEVKGQEIVLANVKGEIFALQGRCGHMNTPLAEGSLDKAEIVCPLHFAHFDVHTGKKITEPVLGGPGMEDMMKTLPEAIQKMMGRQMQLVGMTKTHDLKTYKVKIKGEDVQVDI